MFLGCNTNDQALTCTNGSKTGRPLSSPKPSLDSSIGRKGGALHCRVIDYMKLKSYFINVFIVTFFNMK